MQINSIFVYGTLQLGKSNQHILKKLNGTWKKAYVIGTLINKGWESEYGFPGLKINKNGVFINVSSTGVGSPSKIEGMLFQSEELEKIINDLDEIEGKGYKRVITELFWRMELELKLIYMN